MSILVLTSDTLIGTAAAGNIEYNGQFFGTDSNASRAQLQRITQGTAVASTSGTSIDFTSLPAWIKKITVMFNGVSSNGSSNFIAQLGSGSFTTSGYTSYVSITGAAGTATGSQYTTGLGVDAGTGSAATTRTGLATFCLLTGNTWAQSFQMGFFNGSSAFSVQGGGSIALSGTLDRLRLTTVNGTDTFDAGTINIIYEG